MHGAVESFERDERLRDRESCAAEERRRGRNGVRRLQRAIIQVLRRVHVPELQLDAGIRRRDSHGAFEKSLLDGRRSRHEPLDVELEGFEWKMGHGARAPRAETPRHVRDPARHAVEQREDLRECGGVLDRRPFCSRTEANEPHADTQLVSELHLAEHEIRRPGQLADPDHGRARERRGHRQLQTVERGDPLFAGQRAHPFIGQPLAKQHRRGLTEPERRAGAARGLRFDVGRKRHDEDA